MRRDSHTIEHYPFPQRSAWMLPAFSFMAGILFGIMSRIADIWPDGPHWWFFNVAGVWLGVAFMLGAVSRSNAHGALAGVIGLGSAVAAYYTQMQLIEGQVNMAYVRTVIAPWLLLAILGGSTLGLTGATWRYGSHRARTFSVALLTGLIAGESTFLLLEGRTTTSDAIGLGSLLIIALLLPILLLRERPERAYAYAAASGLVVVGLAAVPIIRFIFAMIE